MFFKSETLVINEFNLDPASFAEASEASKEEELGGPTASPLEARVTKREVNLVLFGFPNLIRGYPCPSPSNLQPLKKNVWTCHPEKNPWLLPLPTP